MSEVTCPQCGGREEVASCCEKWPCECHTWEEGDGTVSCGTCEFAADVAASRNVPEVPTFDGLQARDPVKGEIVYRVDSMWDGDPKMIAATVKAVGPKEIRLDGDTSAWAYRTRFHVGRHPWAFSEAEAWKRYLLKLDAELKDAQRTVGKRARQIGVAFSRLMELEKR